MTVNIARCIPTVEQDLLSRVQAWHLRLAEPARPEAATWIRKPATISAVLPSIASFVEMNRVEVDPAKAASTELDPDRSPIRFHLVAERVQRKDGGSLVPSIDRQIDVSMRSGLVSHQRINAPSAANPERAASIRECAQDLVNLCNIHISELSKRSPAFGR